jgi:hypothetical protein
MKKARDLKTFISQQLNKRFHKKGKYSQVKLWIFLPLSSPPKKKYQQSLSPSQKKRWR